MGTIPDNFEGFAPTSASILVSPISCRRVGSQDPERPRTRPAGKAGLSGRGSPEEGASARLTRCGPLDSAQGPSHEMLRLSISRPRFLAKADARQLGRAHRRSRPQPPRRPERRLGLVEAIGHPAAAPARPSQFGSRGSTKPRQPVRPSQRARPSAPTPIKHPEDENGPRGA